jgi:hypothetical protein
VLAKKPHADKSLEIDDICQTLKMSPSTSYRYVCLQPPVPFSGGISVYVTRDGYLGPLVAGRLVQAILRAEVCATCARNGLAVSCLDHGQPCAQLQRILGRS